MTEKPCAPFSGIKRNYFGTDGIRGAANQAPMTAQTALRVGLAAGRYFTNGTHRHSVVIGKDTRISGYMIEAALQAGFVSVGMDVMLLGPIPTPAVAMLTRSLRADLGVMVSASHNPYHDNGIKLFGPDGYKLSDKIESEIEKLMADHLEENLAAPDQLGRARRLEDARSRYIEMAKHTFPRDLTLNGLRIVVDCAHGGAYKVAPSVFWELGAEIVTIGVTPDGRNINHECGSIAPERAIQKVQETRADLGIVLDGDGDRVILLDEQGKIIDGDQLLAVIATDWQDTDRLCGQGVVSTIMANLGLEKYFHARKLHLQRVNVGDRYVMEAMQKTGCNLGGEQSGHIMLSDYAPTGDGIIAALQALACLRRRAEPPSKAWKLFTPAPQLQKNIRYKKSLPLQDKQVVLAIASAQKQLAGGKGRLVVRPSGTEKMIRVMVESENEHLMQKIASDIAESIEQSL